MTGDRMIPRSSRIGCYLSDHLSCGIAAVHADDRSLASTMFGPVFSKGRMRSFRFVVTSDDPMPRHFAHFIFDIDNPGFRLAKELLSGLQGRHVPDVTFSSAKAGVDGLVKLAYSRFIKSRLLVPEGTPSRLQLDVEQAPALSNRVHLGRDTDRMGRPVAVVHWNVNDVDLENIRSTSSRWLKKWPGEAMGMPRLIPTHADGSAPKPHDAYHPVGTCMMGTDGESTVDLDLRVRGTHNLFVLSTGVFPSAGTANPTFSMLCLGDRLGDLLSLNTMRVKSA
jgi:choline dehydrogenase-like flavoprotein